MRAVFVCLAAAVLTLPVAALSGTVPDWSRAGASGAVPADAAEATEAEARAMCGTACHAYPPPDILPKSAWPHEIAKMDSFRQGDMPGPRTQRHVDLPADMEAMLGFYVSHAPAALGALESWPSVTSASTSRFTRRAFSPERALRPPAVSNVQFMDLERDCEMEIVATDMGAGYVMIGRPSDPAAHILEIIADTLHPARTTLVDLDGDDTDDLIVSELGSFLPGDHQRGGVVWLRGLGRGRYGAYEMTGFPRVADVQAARLTETGALDLLVGAFGWRTTGFIGLMRNLTTDHAQPAFETHRLDERSGAINVVPADLNGDGHLDFVALIAQQHETVVAYLSDGRGRFRVETIHTAPHPNWGYSGMQLVDFDGDNDLDVLVTNGDSFDDFLLKPYHGIEWLENRGGFPFVRHPLAKLAGAHRAVAVDLDGDGDLDVVAAALIAQMPAGHHRDLPSLVWLERTAEGRFIRHTLERGSPFHATLDAADFDSDGDIDLVVGNLSTGPKLPVWIEVWEKGGTK